MKVIRFIYDFKDANDCTRINVIEGNIIHLELLTWGQPNELKEKLKEMLLDDNDYSIKWKSLDIPYEFLNACDEIYDEIEDDVLSNIDIKFIFRDGDKKIEFDEIETLMDANIDMRLIARDKLKEV